MARPSTGWRRSPTNSMGNNIEGRVVVITGASSGLGEATARHLSAQGARVVLGARRVDRLQSLANGLTGRGGNALPVATDVTHCDQRPEVAAHRWQPGQRQT